MVNWNDLAAAGKAEKEEELNENLTKALKGVAMELDELFENPDLSIVDKTRIAEHFRDSMMRFKAGGTRLSLGSSSTPAPAEETTEQSEQQPQSSTPTGTSAEAARVRELENGVSAYVSDAGGTVVQNADGKIDLKASFATVDRVTEKKVNEAKLPTDGLIKKRDVQKIVQGIGTAIGDEKTGFHRSRLGTDTMVISTDNYNKMVAEIHKLEELAGSGS